MSNETNKTKKRATIRPLIITPIVFVLIASIVALPVSFKAFGVAKNRVHQMQQVLAIDFGDISVDTAYFDECAKAGEAQNTDLLQIGEKVGTIECNNAAVGCDVFYGINRVSKRSGAGLSSESRLFGEGGEIKISAYASTYFKALSHVKKGDVFTVYATDGEYKYTVQQVITADKFSGKPDGEYLLLTTEASRDAFAGMNKERLMVVATLGEEEGA